MRWYNENENTMPWNAHRPRLFYTGEFENVKNAVYFINLGTFEGFMECKAVNKWMGRKREWGEGKFAYYKRVLKM